MNRFTVLLGEYDTRVDPEFSQKLGMKSFVQNYGVAKIIRHKDYDPFTKQNDIALIKLSQDVNFTGINIIELSLLYESINLYFKF